VARGTFAAALLALPVACTSSASAPDGDAGPERPATQVVVGVQGDESITGAIGSLHVMSSVAGVPAGDTVVPQSALPYEVRLSPAPDAGAGGGDDGSVPGVAVRVEGYLETGWTPESMSAPILVRTAETDFVPGKTVLLRVVLQGQCLLALPGGPPGAPTCVAPQTCIDGACQSDVVPAQSLEPYDTDWPSNAPDACKPANAGPPVVQVGTGQTDYLPVTPGQTVQMEQGPQGGHHVWIAVRQENLKQAGSTTTITSVVPTTGLVGPRTSYVFNFEPDQGGFCKLFGMRYQLDVDGTDYHQFLGQPLDVTVTIIDAAGATGTGTAHLNIDPQLLCPSGSECP
jgi:hypothetical protein